MALSPEDIAAMPPMQRRAVYQAESEAHLCALSGGARWDFHHPHVKWLAAEIWAIDNPTPITFRPKRTS